MTVSFDWYIPLIILELDLAHVDLSQIPLSRSTTRATANQRVDTSPSNNYTKPYSIFTPICVESEVGFERFPATMTRAVEIRKVATNAAAVCLGPAKDDALEIRQWPRQEPASDEVEVAVEAASVNPIDVRRSEGYGRRVFSLLGAARFPLVLGNDFAGTITAAGSRASPLRIGDRVYGVKPPSASGTHASHILVKAGYVQRAPAGLALQNLATLPYSFITMWLAVRGAGLTRQNASGRRVLVHGAAGGLGTLALQMLSIWGASTTAIARASGFDACRQAGAVSVVDAAVQPFSDLGHSFDATLNFASWDDDLALIGCLKEGALGHATTVHPMLGILDKDGWIRGGLKLLGEKRRRRAALPKGAKNYAWVAFQPNKQALSDLSELVERNALNLPIALRVPLAQVREAFDHVRQRRGGRALILPH